MIRKDGSGRKSRGFPRLFPFLMKYNTDMITKKKLTKFLDSGYRRRVIMQMTEARRQAYKIPQYARYVVDSQIVHRDPSKENDKEYGYGFSPVNFICAVMKDGTVDKRFFEFNTVNHFLRKKDGDSACEVVEAILVEWAKEDKNIRDFDMQVIDDELAKIEAEYVEQERKKAKEEQEKSEEKDNAEAVQA